MLQISSHLMACAWMLMALVHISWFGRKEDTWLEAAGVDLERDSIGSQYMQCLYYSVTIMATVGAMHVQHAWIHIVRLGTTSSDR